MTVVLQREWPGLRADHRLHIGTNIAATSTPGSAPKPEENHRAPRRGRRQGHCCQVELEATNPTITTMAIIAAHGSDVR